MSAAWAGVVVSVILCAAGLGAVIARTAYRAGRVEEAIERLTGIAERHDTEIRELQRNRR